MMPTLQLPLPVLRAAAILKPKLLYLLGLLASVAGVACLAYGFALLPFALLLVDKNHHYLVESLSMMVIGVWIVARMVRHEQFQMPVIASLGIATFAVVLYFTAPITLSFP